MLVQVFLAISSKNNFQHFFFNYQFFFIQIFLYFLTYLKKLKQNYILYPGTQAKNSNLTQIKYPGPVRSEKEGRFALVTFVVGMSCEKLFVMCRIDEFWNINETFSHFFKTSKTETAKQGRDS